MEAKIPFISLKDPPSLELSSKAIKCSLCEGIIYEPVYSPKTKLTYCKSCFQSQKIFKNDNSPLNFTNLYNPAVKESKKKLNMYNYVCPNFDFEENQKENEYTYDELINHLIVCQNNRISCPECGEETFLKSLEINHRQDLENILIKNKILERELEYQKSRILQMEEEKKETKELAIKKEEEKKQPPPPVKEKEKEKIIVKSVNKPPIKMKKKSSQNLIKVPKGPLPPIRIKNKLYSKREASPPPKLNFEKKNNFKKPKPKETFPDNSKNNTLFDKCPHFYGNYMPKFACCNKFYGCYLCHNITETHVYQFSNKVACLFCKTVYAGKTCPKCKAIQKFQRKTI